MATVTSVTRHWLTAKEGFTTTLNGSIISGAATVPLNSVTGYTDGDQIAMVIEPSSASAKQVFTGTIDVANTRIINVIWSEGTNQGHNSAVTVADYVTATHMAALVKGLTVKHNQDGTLKTRITATTSSATPTPAVDTTDQYEVTALAANATFGAPTGTPVDGQKLVIRIKDNGTSRTLAWNAIYRGIGIVLPAATAISKMLYLVFIYNGTDVKWDCVGTAQET